MRWGLLIANRAARQLRRLSDPEKKTIADALDARQPFSWGCEISLRSRRAAPKSRRNWRILYELDEERRIIRVTAIKRRGSNTY
jgi:mRNA-degrading endonuclease RelE of RelBE toxin-antitoxin system